MAGVGLPTEKSLSGRSTYLGWEIAQSIPELLRGFRKHGKSSSNASCLHDVQQAHHSPTWLIQVERT